MDTNMMFDEMRAAGSKIPEMVTELQLCGWVTYKHHDNWIRKEWKDDPNVENMGLDLHAAYYEITKIPKAIATLKDVLGKDKSPGSYYYSWQANIAMAFIDECNRWREKHKKENIPAKALHEISNKAAKYFLDLLIS